MGPLPPPSEQRTAFRARRGLRTTMVSQWSSFGRIASAVAPGRLPDRLPFVEFFQEEYPPVLVMKACQGSIPQRTKGPFAPMGHRYRGSRTHGPMVGSTGGDNEDKRWGFPPGRPPRAPGLSCLATRSPQEDAGLCADVKDPTARRDR